MQIQKEAKGSKAGNGKCAQTRMYTSSIWDERGEYTSSDTDSGSDSDQTAHHYGHQNVGMVRKNGDDDGAAGVENDQSKLAKQMATMMIEPYHHPSQPVPLHDVSVKQPKNNSQKNAATVATEKQTVSSNLRCSVESQKSKNDKVEDKIHQSLVVCWRGTKTEAFMVVCDPINGEFLKRLQLTYNFRYITESGQKQIIAGQWYTIKYSHYKRSEWYVLLHEPPKPAKAMFETRLDGDGVVQFKIHAKKYEQSQLTKNNGTANNYLFYSYVGDCPIVGTIPTNLCDSKAFLAWCRLNEKFIDDENGNSFVFMEHIPSTKTTSTPASVKTNSVPVNDFATEADKMSCANEENGGDSVTITNNVPIAQEHQQIGIIMKEVAVLPKYLGRLMEELTLHDFTTSECRWEPPEEGSNAIRIIGTNQQQIKEGADTVRAIRKKLIQQYEKEEREKNNHDIGISTDHDNHQKNIGQEENSTTAVQEHNLNSNNTEEMKYTKYMQIPRRFYPWIRGPYQRDLKQVEQEKGVKICLPDHDTPGNDVVLKGRDPDVLEEFTKKFNNRLDQLRRTVKEKKFCVPHDKHMTILPDAVLEQTDASVELPCAKDQEQDIIRIRGTEETIEAALAILRDQIGAGFVKEIALKQEIAQVSKLERKLQEMTKRGPQMKPIVITANDAKPGPKQQPTSSNGIKNNSNSELPKLVEQTRASSSLSLKQTGTKTSSQLQQNKQRDQSVAAARKPTTLLTKTIEMSLDVPKHFHGNLIGKDGNNLNRMENTYAVRIHVPTEYSKSEKIIIKGADQEKISKCCNEITNLVDRLQNECIEYVRVQRRLIPLIVGAGGKNIRKLRVKYPRVADVEIPWGKENTANDCLEEGELVEDCTITLYGYRDEVKLLADEIIKFHTELELTYHQEFLPLPTDDPNHTAAEYLKYLRGTNCSKIRRLNQQYPDVKIDFPVPNDGQQGSGCVIKMEGPLQKVDTVMQILLSEIQELKARKRMQRVEQIVPIMEEKYVEKFLRLEAKLLREIKEEHTKCFINLDKQNLHFLIEGKLEDVEAAKLTIEEILAKMVEIVRDVQIPVKFHGQLRLYVSEIRQKFEVKVTFPPLRKQSGLVHLVGSNEAALDAAERELLDRCPITEQLEVPKEYRSKLMQDNAKYLNQLARAHNVTIRSPLPQQPLFFYSVVISGQKQNVQQCLVVMRSELPITQTVSIPTELRGAFIGIGGDNLRRVQQKHDVKINLPAESMTATVVGNAVNVCDCVADIEATIANQMREKQEKSFEININVPQELHGRLIGSGGSQVKKLAERHNVKIIFGMNTATITGRKLDCQQCMDEITLRMEQFPLSNNNNNATTTTTTSTHSTVSGGSRFASSAATASSAVRNPFVPSFGVSTTTTNRSGSTKPGGSMMTTKNHQYHKNHQNPLFDDDSSNNNRAGSNNNKNDEQRKRQPANSSSSSSQCTVM